MSEGAPMYLGTPPCTHPMCGGTHGHLPSIQGTPPGTHPIPRGHPLTPHAPTPHPGAPLHTHPMWAQHPGVLGMGGGAHVQLGLVSPPLALVAGIEGQVQAVAVSQVDGVAVPVGDPVSQPPCAMAPWGPLGPPSPPLTQMPPAAGQARRHCPPHSPAGCEPAWGTQGQRGT